MRKKYVAITISVVMIALIITFGQIFTVKNVKVEFKNETGMATEQTILELADITSNTNIFSLKESKIKQNINDYYSNSLIVDVERVFPNTVTIHVKERLPMFLVSVNNDSYSGYVYTDIDFQRSDIAQGLDKHIITVENYTVKNTFDTAQCIAVRVFAKTLLDNGMEQSAIVAFVESITINDDNLTVNLRQNNAVFVINRNKVQDSTTLIYHKYLSLSVPERVGAVLSFESL
ncbi:MAG: FtsQ-type POTRA domain-containing protein [Clostridiales bacterium]|nr:FtsQ-type POTRA domain-containing protein [Clostridiales bacterium]